MNPDDDYVLPHQRLSTFDVLNCPLSVTECFLSQSLVCGTVFHHTSLLPPSLSIFCCQSLKSHLFSLSYPAFWLFSHLHITRAVTRHFGHYNRYYIQHLQTDIYNKSALKYRTINMFGLVRVLLTIASNLFWSEAATTPALRSCSSLSMSTCNVISAHWPSYPSHVTYRFTYRPTIVSHTNKLLLHISVGFTLHCWTV